MYRSISLEEDLALKKVITDRATAPEAEGRFDWRSSLDSTSADRVPEIIVTHGNEEEEELSLAKVADTIGSALTNLLVSRQQQEDSIFSDENRTFVSNVAQSVSKSLTDQVETVGQIRLSHNDLYLLIEKALIENDAHDVAKSLVFSRSLEKNGEVIVSEEPQQMPVRLIRRSGNVVPWSQTKIEIAVRKAFLSIKEDPEAAVKVSNAVTETIRNGESAFAHIENVQDIVQEELMRQGYFKAAEAYILYRAKRAQMRLDEAPEEDPNQESMVVVTMPDGSTQFWDGTELKKRIAFGSIGLDLCLSEQEIEQELRRSIGAEITREDLTATIILNAKSLIEKDADFAKFAGRILLTFIYEEVLDWNILTDGIRALKNAHKVYFKKYLAYGVDIKRISPEVVAKYDITKLAEALDPTADLDFDYLGIQTLYDRYLIVDKTGDKQRRLETPQFFWMRVSMGLSRAEDEIREDWAIRLYNLYKGRRFCSSTPTLFNSGTLHSQLSSCYLYKVDDSIESIMQRGIAENAYLSKWAGGLGGSWTAVRLSLIHI